LLVVLCDYVLMSVRLWPSTSA